MEEHINWEGVIAGDVPSHTALYNLYFDRLFNYGRKLTADESLIEDTIQETFVRLWADRQKLPPAAAWNGYIFRMFRNALFRHFRDAERHRLSPDELEARLPEFNADHILLARESDAAMQARLRKAIGALSARQREAIFLRFYENLSYDEIAAVMDISVKASYKLMARALNEMREAMGVSLVALLFLLRPC
ncbi:RNA polymerase sigma factor [Chitinophaga rhizosphaerae]|uniref:RNA polymerase sigma factor n=1 Tax=Chitinophaga rhizosphaerae TaxID=1864947 RepID=UPI000F8078C6|nr:RNA polymerase sigma factor [Chitinophaga rhizosphaerae]